MRLAAWLSTSLVCFGSVGWGQGLASFKGTVIDSASRPIENAEVFIRDVGLSTRSNVRGEFRIDSILPGKHLVYVRRIGFADVEAVIDFAPRTLEERRVRMGQLTVLEPVTTVDVGNDPMMRAFEEHRARGFGRFVTRVELERFEAVTMRTVALQFSEIRWTGFNGTMFPMGARGPNTQCKVDPFTPGGTDVACIKRERVLYVPTDEEVRRGAKIACYAEVWMDRTLLNRGFPTTPFDLNTIPVSEVEAMEWYGGASQVPHEYRTMNTSFCGVMILHTRRFKKK